MRYIPYESFIGFADAFLNRHHPSYNVPVPIEQIIEFQLSMHIIPMDGLRNRFGIDAYISADQSEIRIDRWVFDYGKTRLAFSLAHEIAHLLLGHHKLLENIESPSDWIGRMQNLPRAVYDRMEYQANCVAACILVPRRKLAERFAAIKAGLSSGDITELEIQDAAEKVIARQYGVNGRTMQLRLRNENLLKYPWDD